MGHIPFPPLYCFQYISERPITVSDKLNIVAWKIHIYFYQDRHANELIKCDEIYYVHRQRSDNIFSEFFDSCLQGIDE